MRRRWSRLSRPLPVAALSDEREAAHGLGVAQGDRYLSDWTGDKHTGSAHRILDDADRARVRGPLGDGELDPSLSGRPPPGLELKPLAGHHDRGSNFALRLALDHPSAVTHAVFLDSLPISEHLDRCDAAFAAAWWHWFFFAQPEVPERVIMRERQTYDR